LYTSQILTIKTMKNITQNLLSLSKLSLLLFVGICLSYQPVFSQNWLRQGADIDGKNASERSDSAIAMDANGTVLAVGAPWYQVNDEYDGLVRVYSWDGTNWNQLGKEITNLGVGARVGSTVSLSDDGNTLAIGATGNDSNGEDAGSAVVFTWDGSTWTQKGKFILGDEGDDLFGYDVDLDASGDIIAVGAAHQLLDRSHPGYTKIFEWNGTDWVQRGPTIVGETNGDRAGYSVSLNDAGDVLAIGAISNDANGTNSGQVRVYSWNGSDWAQKGTDVDGAGGDWFGHSVSLSDDGNVFAASSPPSDASARIAGQVVVFEWDGSDWVHRGQALNGENALAISFSFLPSF
jgi:hypothetical protein